MSNTKMGDSHHSTNAQIFPDEEVVEQKSTSDRVADLLNQAVVPVKDGQKIQNLRQVQELIIYKEPNLLDNFLDEVLAFQHDRNSEVRRFVVNFISKASTKNPEILPKVIANLNMLLTDEATAVQKCVIQVAPQLYKVALRWLSAAKSIDGNIESVWAYITQLKTKIISLLESENDGVRTHTIKFMEMIVITQTYSDNAEEAEREISLDDIPLIIKVFRHSKMEEEAKYVFEMLILHLGTPHISSVNLMACMQSLVLIAKERSEFMLKVLQALEALHANLPPTLGKSQVTSVRKHLKLQLASLGKHAAIEYHTQILTLLTDLGATPQEISRCMLKVKQKKRKRTVEEGNKTAKRYKWKEINEKKDENELKSPPKIDTNTAIDVTVEHLVSKLNCINVSDLVLISMISLPEFMPSQFQASYTPIAVAGTAAQIKHLAQLLAVQLTAVGLDKRVEEIKETKGFSEVKCAPPGQIQTSVDCMVDHEQKQMKPPLLMPRSHSKNISKWKQFDLSDITKPLTDEQANKMSDAALLRIIHFGKNAPSGDVSVMRNKILVTLATQFRGSISAILKSHIFENLGNRTDIALAWLYEEYACLQGFSQVSHLQSKNSVVEYYEECMAGLLEELLHESNLKDRDTLFGQFFLNSPYITDGLADYLKKFCEDESTIDQGMYIAKTMVECRLPKQLLFLSIVSELTLHERSEVRNKAIKTVKQLHKREHLQSYIEAFALRSLNFLLGSVPPSALTVDNPSVWTEDTTKICSHLYLELLPISHRLIHDLANVYAGTTTDIKRAILQALEIPVKGIGMSSPELLLLVENCPKGAETLVTRTVHILTEETSPSSELVARVRDLYSKRVPDVRFLIPILNGLSKKEVIEALPELISLNLIVVKEVFNRLLGSHAESGTNITGPLTPIELLISLHNIDTKKCDMKTIIKAITLCFSEKHVYTQEVLAMVMQQLIEQNPLPTLLMRTVIQSLLIYPQLIGLVMHILQRLILKQVWKEKKIWEGFIKCCQKTKPQSFQVLLQLPPSQLENVFDANPNLRELLFQHVESFTEHQKAHIPQAILDIISVEQKPIKENQ